MSDPDDVVRGVAAVAVVFATSVLNFAVVVVAGPATRIAKVNTDKVRQHVAQKICLLYDVTSDSMVRLVRVSRRCH